MFMFISKIIFLVLAITYGFCCFGRLIRKESISSGQIFFMAIGLAGFVGLQWLI